MDAITKLKQAAIQVIQDYYDFLGQDPDSELQLIIDEKNNHYLLLETGWYKNQRLYGSIIHIDLTNGKLWIQHDSTEEGVANELVKLGISPQKIVLAFKTPERRKITDFAVA